MTPTNSIVEFPIVGQKYHVVWAGENPAFRLIDIGAEYAVIKADSKKKVIATKISDLRHTKSSAKHWDNTRQGDDWFERVRTIETIKAINYAEGVFCHQNKK